MSLEQGKNFSNILNGKKKKFEKASVIEVQRVMSDWKIELANC